MSGVGGIADIWAAAVGVKQLLQITVTNAAPAGTKTWLAICVATAADSAVVAIEYKPLFTTLNSDGTGTITNTSPILSFGKDGMTFPPSFVDVVSGSIAHGCTLYITDTASPQANPSLNNIRSADTTAIVAYYK